MLDGTLRPLQNAFALKAIMKNPVMPNKNLAVAGDDEMSNVPLVIFRDQHQPMPAPVLPNVMDISYEQAAVKGAGDTLSMDDFVTDDFAIGPAYDFLI